MTLQLPDDLGKFIEDQLKAGEYSSAQEVVCAGLRLLKTHSVASTADDFEPGEWNRLLAEGEGTEAMSLDEAIAKRRAERGSAKGRTMTISILARSYRDISEIWNYIAADNPTAADDLEDQFFAAMKKLGEQPGMGHQRADVDDPRYRFWRVGAYMLAYRVDGSKLTVCRVVHASRDFRGLF